MRINRREFCKFALSALPLSAACHTRPKRPNILFILADDHTRTAISCYNGPLARLADTANIDRLADGGVKLTHAFCTNSICSPSRATLLTGQYSHVHGVRCLGQSLDPGRITLPVLFQKAGYQTAVFGKWHLRSRPQGFDDCKVLKVQGRYRDPQFLVKGGGQMETLSGWSTDIITELSMDYIRNRDRSRPFLVLCHFKATHDPWDSREPYKSMYRDEVFPEPANLYDNYANRSQAARRATLKLEMINQSTYPHSRLENADWREQRGHIYRQYIKDFIRCGRVLDENVGRLLDFLKNQDLEDDTVVIYTADQGHFLGEHGFFSKRFMYEEAMGIPFLIRFPEGAESGRENDDMIANIDIAPTLLDIAGIEIPHWMQGRSFLNRLKAEPGTEWLQAVYYHYWQHLLHRDVAAHYGIRTRNRKLIFYYGLPLGQTDYPPTEPEWEMFDLQKDPAEMRNVYDDPAYEDEIPQLKNELAALQKRFGDTVSAYPELARVHEK